MTRQRLFVAVVLLLGGLAAIRLVRLPALPFSNGPAPCVRFVPLGPDRSLVQTVTLPWDSFSRLRVRLAPGRERAGNLEIDIATGPLTTPVVLRHAVVPIGTVTKEGYVDISFEPIPASRGQQVQIAVRATATSPPVALWANSSDTYAGGALLIGGTASGDLVFAAFSRSHDPATFLTAMTAGRPWPLNSAWAVVVLAGLFVLSVAWIAGLSFSVAGGDGFG
jgi:hypothetical protein